MNTTPKTRRGFKLLLVFMLGLYTLAAQILLFRSFLGIYEGSEFGIGVFFGSWLVWVVIGALLSRITLALKRNLAHSFDLLILLFIPAFLLQEYLIGASRNLAGIAPYEAFPFLQMIPLSILVNAPTSILTGWLFPLACEWLATEEQERKETSVASVYLFEALGAFGGGVLVTVFLALGTSDATLFCYTALTIALATSAYRIVVARNWSILLVPLIILLTIVANMDGYWTEMRNRASWDRLLEQKDYEGHFTTAHTRYLYGASEGQFNVLAWESVAESIPEPEHSAEVAALTMAQNPDAQNILVIGMGSYSLCRQYTRFPSITNLTWLTTDPSYTSELAAVLPEDLQADSEIFDMPREEVNHYLRTHGDKYDLIAINLPDPDTLLLNRYYTRDFYKLLNAHLNEGGIACVRVTAAENFLGTELARIGASVYATLKTAFADIAIKPGDESWLIATGAGDISQSANDLKNRYASIKGAKAVYPPDGLLSLYPADRAKFQLRRYRSTLDESAEGELINTDSHPKALLNSLLANCRQQGASSELISHILHASKNGFFWFLVLILLYAAVRSFAGRANQPSIFDSGFLVWSTGLVGLALNIVLMFIFQSRFGSIYLFVGLLSSLFMLGLFIGGNLCRRALARAPDEKPILLAPLILHAALCVGAFWIANSLGQTDFVWFFLLCGAFGGVYVPIASRQMHRSEMSVGATGSLVDACDHLGGAFGALLTGLILLPLFGAPRTLIILALLLLSNVPAAAHPRSTRKSTSCDTSDTTLKGLGAILLIAAAISIVVAHGSHPIRTAQKTKPVIPNSILGEISTNATPETITLENGSTLLCYKTKRDELIFNTARLAPDVRGYNGKIDMAVKVDTNGVLQRLQIIRHSETPYYMRLLDDWIERLQGVNIKTRDPTRTIDAVSGATVTSEAILRTLTICGNKISSTAGTGTGTYVQPKQSPLPKRRVIALAILLGMALCFRTRPQYRTRRLYLIAVVVAAGVILNLQYSLDQVLSLLALRLPSPGLNAAFVLVAGIPLITILFGNIYCGYLCPFGALQELLGDLLPARLMPSPEKRIWRYTRGFKYVILFGLVTLFAVEWNLKMAGLDPLVSVFSSPKALLGSIALAALLLSIPFKRFWCRNLCPAGAFLAILNRFKLIRPLIPKTKPVYCDLGVRNQNDLDCIGCDRCRAAQKKKQPSNRVVNALLVLAVLLFIIIWVNPFKALGGATKVPPAASTSPAPEADQETKVYPQPPTGEARNLDMNRIRELIREQKLSDHEALYYQRLGQSGTPSEGLEQEP